MEKGKARRKMIDELRMKMREMQSEGPLKDGMAVKVASNSPEGIQKGLEKAQDIVQDEELIGELSEDTEGLEDLEGMEALGELPEETLSLDEDLDLSEVGEVQEEDMVAEGYEDLSNLSREELIEKLKEMKSR